MASLSFLYLVFPLLPTFLVANPRGPYRHSCLTRQCPRATAYPALSQPANVRQRLGPLSVQRVFSACSYPTQLKLNENVLVVMTLADAASTEVIKLQKHDVHGGPPRDTHMERPGNIAPPCLG